MYLVSLFRILNFLPFWDTACNLQRLVCLKQLLTPDGKKTPLPQGPRLLPTMLEKHAQPCTAAQNISPDSRTCKCFSTRATPGFFCSLCTATAVNLHCRIKRGQGIVQIIQLMAKKKKKQNTKKKRLKNQTWQNRSEGDTGSKTASSQSACLREDVYCLFPRVVRYVRMSFVWFPYVSLQAIKRHKYQHDDNSFCAPSVSSIH